eukprot:CAMPEP_0172513628 /NCGR_PEP_ID=MMETSP1066-20121228/254008_1 /TAXON_ID=671091 /ORGANISM="Coscinodiscus wailesii, Strain CCMP2513" /LENGTH=47 /DNA_ID= /DNA_START= /DNA_END= /DNA_ORIENTATION=
MPLKQSTSKSPGESSTTFVNADNAPISANWLPLHSMAHFKKFIAESH